MNQGRELLKTSLQLLLENVRNFTNLWLGWNLVKFMCYRRCFNVI